MKRKLFISSRYSLSAVLIVLTLLVVLLAACASSPSTTPAPATTTPAPTTSTPAPTTTTTPAPSTTTPTTSPAGTPTIQITQPGSGNQFGIGNTKVNVQVSNFNIVDKLGQPNRPGEGHIHYFMDVIAPTAAGQPAVTAAGTYAAAASTSYTWSNVGGGSHTFSVELVNNDHTPLVPPVVQSVTLLVIPEIGPPGLVILTPRDGAIIPAGDITVTVQVANFNLLDKLGQANAQREGHLHYFLDITAPTTPGQPAITAPGTYAASASDSYTWKNVSPGMHNLSVELINNDHTPLDPPIVAKIMVNVTGTTPTATSTQSPAPVTTPSPTSSGQTVTIDLTAQNIAFDKNTITVPAGANVIINFNNKDSGIPHNVSVYQNLSGGQTKPVFVGGIITGPAATVYTFTAPAAGNTYFFDCDVHPQIMTGSFIITP